MRYPTDIVTAAGWARIHRGHNLTLDTLVTDFNALNPTLVRDVSLDIEEVNLRLAPRVKWCSRVDGFGCDNDGEWHAHWFAVKPAVGTEFTLVSRKPTRPC